jgi:UDP-glucose-4-epimerase GalE
LRVLVAGGAGYIGLSVARLLHQRGDVPVIYDDFSTGFRTFTSRFETIEGDIGDRDKLTGALVGVDAVMHFAARAYVGESFLDPSSYYDTNVTKALSLLDSVNYAGIDKFIFSSSCAVYGIPATGQITEDTPRVPINPYGETKATFENALVAYSRAYGLKFLALRYFNAAGAEENGMIGELHDPETHLVPLIMRAAIAPFPPVSIFGSDYQTPDGTCIRDYIHVSDLAEAHLAGLDYLMQSGDPSFVNLGTGKGSSILELLALAEEVSGTRISRNFQPRRLGDPAILICNGNRAKQLLGWKPKRNLREIVYSAWIWEQQRSRLYKSPL